jgi:hypothetical protein
LETGNWNKEKNRLWMQYVRKYSVSQEECARLREGVPYVNIYRYNPEHLCPKLNGYGDNGQRKVRSCVCFTHYTYLSAVEAYRLVGLCGVWWLFKVAVT